LELLAHKNPELSILEIGAGTGGTTHDVVSALSAEEGAPHSFSNYTFTDIGSAFCQKAEEDFAQYKSSMTFKVLDIEQDPSTQGFVEGSYDVIIATSVLHATQYMNETLKNTKKLLKPGGKLCLIEPTNPMMWIGLIFGCLSGWWR
jgi:ubiquinone/menaquinone biosynthesis C-methylase UbiE